MKKIVLVLISLFTCSFLMITRVNSFLFPSAHSRLLLKSVPGRRRYLSSSSVIAGIDTESVYSKLDKNIKKALLDTFGETEGPFESFLFASKVSIGDYQSTVALNLSKKLKIPPKEIANRLISSLSNIPEIKSVDISGAGFINLYLADHFINERLKKKLVDKERVGIPKVANPQKVVVDFSSPNIAKEMHVGHLRSTIIGESISRVHEFLGHNVLRVNHVGDWGTQFGMLIAYLKSLLSHTNSNTNTNQSSRNAFDHLQLTDFEDFYKKAKKRFDEDLSFQQESRQEVVRLQSLDPESLQYWSFLCEKSREEFQSIYQLLNIHQLIERGESFYNRRLPSLLMRLQAKGLLSDSQQAKVMYLESFPAPDAQQQEEGEGIASKGFPLMLQKSDGGYLYATTDLAALDYRIEEDRADKIVYVTDAGQATHFQMIFEAARKAGILSDQSTRVVHVPFGLVLGENGKRMKTRSGGNVKLKELLSEAIQRCEEEFLKREQKKLSASAAVAVMMSEEEIRQRATVMGMSAVKYADLSMNRETNYRFSFDKMLSLQGNTAPYMLYTFSRIRGIQRKALESFLASEQGTTVDHSSLERQIIERAFDHEFRFESPQEHRLAKVLLRADDILFDVEKNLYPHRICEYLYDLSHHFNSFYEHCPVMKAKDEDLMRSRMALCSITADTIRVLLNLLGIETLEKI